MNKKTLIGILWPVTILVALWLGTLIGTRNGTTVGRAEAANAYTWGLSSDLADTAQSCDDPKIKEVLSGVQSLIQAVRQPEKYPAQVQEFQQKITALQHQPAEDKR